MPLVFVDTKYGCLFEINWNEQISGSFNLETPLFLILFFLFHFQIESKAQQLNYENYYTTYNNYLICKLDSDETSAYENLKAALKLNPPFDYHLNEMIEIELQKGKRRSALKYAKTATLQGYQYYHNRLTTKADSPEYLFKDSTFLKKLSKKYPKWRRIFESRRSPYYYALNIELQRMAACEQYVRYYIHTTDSSTWHYTNEADSIHFFKFKEIVMRYGFPETRKLDMYSTDCLYLLIGHFRCLAEVTQIDSSEMNWLDSVVWAAVKHGEILPNYYAATLDHYYCFKSRKSKELQLYGEFNWTDAFTDIIDIENVDLRRKKIFLIPLRYKAKLNNLPLPKEYKF